MKRLRIPTTLAEVIEARGEVPSAKIREIPASIASASRLSQIKALPPDVQKNTDDALVDNDEAKKKQRFDDVANKLNKPVTDAAKKPESAQPDEAESKKEKKTKKSKATIVTAPVSTTTAQTITTVTSSSKMKKWPEDSSVLVNYEELAHPLKRILDQGYRLFRKDEKKEFDYDGFNIGKNELTVSPPPKFRFTEKLLKYDKTHGRNLIDVVLNVMFLLGVEQGRRAERRDHKPIEGLVKTMDNYREENKNLRIKIDELEVLLEVGQSNPELTGEALKQAVLEGVRNRRGERIHKARQELQMDATRSTFDFSTPKRAKFKELEHIAKTLNKNICSSDQWKTILKEKGWTFQEWKDRCKKKSVTSDFS